MKPSVRELATLSLIAAVMTAGKEVLAFLPNIEPVTLLLMCTAIVYGWRAMYPCYVFVMLEGLLYGFGWWFFFYLYVWAILVAAVCLLRRAVSSRIIWAAVAGIFGLLFGPMSALQSLIVGGWRMAFSYWIAGIPFDIIHCIGNAALCALLLPPLTGLMEKLSHPRQNNEPF